MTFDTLLSLAQADGALVAQASARLDSALSTAEPGDASWQVDLTIPRFEWREHGEVLFAGPCLLLGTLVGEGFLWGWLNPSLDDGVRAAVKSALSRVPQALQGSPEPIFAPRKDVLVVASWLAGTLGYTGCFVGKVGDAQAFLAVGLTEGPGADGWCCFCGALRRQRRALYAGAEGIMLCDKCARDVVDIAMIEGGSSGGPPLSEAAVPTLRYCVFCLEPRGGLILARFAGVCLTCAEKLAAQLRSSP